MFINFLLRSFNRQLGSNLLVIKRNIEHFRFYTSLPKPRLCLVVQCKIQRVSQKNTFTSILIPTYHLQKYTNSFQAIC